MAIVSRKARPLSRSVGYFRDDRLFIVACDDTYAPHQYFSFFRIPRVQIHVVKTQDGTSAATHVLDRLKGVECEPDDERWMLLDTDHCIGPNHIATFTRAVKEAQRNEIKVALSRPCFELWLLLHHVDHSEVLGLDTARDVEARLRAVLGQYNKTRLMTKDFPIGLIAEACRRAKLLDENTDGGLIPAGSTTRVYQLWRSIVESANPVQLPKELLCMIEHRGRS